MASVRIDEIANELGYSPKEIIEKAKEMGLKVKSASSTVAMEEAESIYYYVQSGVLPTKYKSKSKKIPKNSEIKEKDIRQSNKEIKLDLDEEKIKNKNTIAILETKEKKIEKDIKPEVNLKQDSQDLQEESLASSSLKKRRGIVIVKKKKDATRPIQPEPKVAEYVNEDKVDYTDIFSNSETSQKKKKKEKKHQPASIKKELATKMEILGDKDFADIVIDDEDVVMLPDFTVKPIEVEKKSSIKTAVIMKNSQNNTYGNFDGNNISRGSRKKHKKVQKDSNKELVTSIQIPKEIRVYEFAEKINKQPSEIISKLFLLGMMTTKNDFLGEDEIEILAQEFNIEIEIIDNLKEFDYISVYENSEDKDNDLSLRAPVITIMGHVDHGKTSLLDYIRNSRVASGEAGGITQHVGAYMIEKNDRKITFIDTPGHEAFTGMRARGAEITDIVIVVVAADDGVKPQTKEAIAHAKAAKVPIIIAINKMDKENANPDLVKTGLSDLGIMPIEWGGENEFIEISAKTGKGIDELLEVVLLQADILELKANANRKAKAVVIESSIQKGRGAVATVIVQNGTLRAGDTVVAGVAFGKIRAILDDSGRALKQILPGECGVIVGLSEIPEAGEILINVNSEKEARDYAQKRYEYLRQKELSKSIKVSLDELSSKIAEGNLKTLNIVLKADVQGSLEAIKFSLEKLKNDEIKVDIIHSGIGGITQNDVALANASDNCIILGFNIRPTGDIKAKAKESGIEIKTYNVIYNLIDDIKGVLSGLMSPIIREEDMGQAEIRQVINVPKVGQIAGCMVTDGLISRGAKIRVIRDGVVVFEGNVSSLKRFKDDVKEVAKGYECGVGIDGYNDMKVGDYIESFREKEEKATL